MKTILARRLDNCKTSLKRTGKQEELKPIIYKGKQHKLQSQFLAPTPVGVLAESSPAGGGPVPLSEQEIDRLDRLMNVRDNGPSDNRTLTVPIAVLQEVARVPEAVEPSLGGSDSDVDELTMVNDDSDADSQAPPGEHSGKVDESPTDAEVHAQEMARMTAIVHAARAGEAASMKAIADNAIVSQKRAESLAIADAESKATLQAQQTLAESPAVDDGLQTFRDLAKANGLSASQVASLLKCVAPADRGEVATAAPRQHLTVDKRVNLSVPYRDRDSVLGALWDESIPCFYLPPRTDLVRRAI